MTRKLSKEAKAREKGLRHARAVKEEMNAIIRKLGRGAGTLDYSLDQIRLDWCRENIDDARSNLDVLFVAICDLQGMQDDLIEADSE